MKLRSALTIAGALLALLAAPALAGTQSGKVVAVDENSITVMKDGESGVYILPPDLEIRTKRNQTVTPTDLRGRNVTVTFAESPMGKAEGHHKSVMDESDRHMAKGHAKSHSEPRVTHIRIDGDVDIDADADIEEGE